MDVPVGVEQAAAPAQDRARVLGVDVMQERIDEDEVEAIAAEVVPGDVGGNEGAAVAPPRVLDVAGIPIDADVIAMGEGAGVGGGPPTPGRPPAAPPADRGGGRWGQFCLRRRAPATAGRPACS